MSVECRRSFSHSHIQNAFSRRQSLFCNARLLLLPVRGVDVACWNDNDLDTVFVMSEHQLRKFSFSLKLLEHTMKNTSPVSATANATMLHASSDVIAVLDSGQLFLFEQLQVFAG
jgi:hypothetical protein